MTLRLVSSRTLAAIGCLSAFGCENQAQDGDFGTGLVCPSCQPAAGGETSDFGGEESECSRFFQRLPITLEAAAELGFDIAQLDVIFAESMTSSFGWRAFDDFIPGERPWTTGAEPTGYQTDTSITVDLRRTGAVEYGGYDPQRCDAQGVCEDPSSHTLATCILSDPRGFLILGAEMRLQLADGSIEVTTAIELSSWQSGGLSTDFSVDLSSVSGALRLSPERLGPFAGTLHGTLHLAPGNVRGILYPEIAPSAALADTDLWRYRPLVGHFPTSDECDVYDVPVDPDTGSGRAIIREVDDLYAKLQPLARAASPFSVRWTTPSSGDEIRGGAVTALHVELSPTARALCRSPEGLLSIAADGRIRTDDGLFTWNGELRGGMRETQGNEPADLQLFIDEYFDSDAPFWEVNAPRVELWGSEAGRMLLKAGVIAFVDRAEPQAQLIINAVPACALDPRCESDEQECRACGRRLRVAGFDVVPEEPTLPIDEPPASP